MPHMNAPTADLPRSLVHSRTPSLQTGHCTCCSFDGPGWVYLGPQIGPDAVTVAFHLWDCPSCRSTKSAPTAHRPPQPTDRRVPA